MSTLNGMTPNLPQEQVDINKILGIYRTKLAQVTEEIIIMEARLLNRDEEIARLRTELADYRELPDVPHN